MRSRQFFHDGRPTAKTVAAEHSFAYEAPPKKFPVGICLNGCQTSGNIV
jgi:hypothetical protein